MFLIEMDEIGMVQQRQEEIGWHVKSRRFLLGDDGDDEGEKMRVADSCWMEEQVMRDDLPHNDIIYSLPSWLPLSPLIRNCSMRRPTCSSRRSPP